MCSICAQVSQNFQIFQIFSPPLVIVYFFNTPGSIPGGIGYFPPLVLFQTVPGSIPGDSDYFYHFLKTWKNEQTHITRPKGFILFTKYTFTGKITEFRSHGYKKLIKKSVLSNKNHIFTLV